MIKETFKLTCISCKNFWLWTPFIWNVCPRCPNKCQDRKGITIQLSFVSTDPVKVEEIKEIIELKYNELGNENLPVVK